MKYRSISVVLLLFCYLLRPAAQSSVPSAGEVKVAMQSLIVATTATVAAQRLDPPLVFEEARFISDPSLSYFVLTLDQCDIGNLRERVLAQPLPQVRQMGFLEALFSSMIPILPDFNRMITYLQAQALLAEEVIISGSMQAVRLAAPYPFRYEGSGTFAVSGSRITEPFSLEISFIMPLEGTANGAVIPIQVTANGKEYIDVAQSLFPLPPYVHLQEELQYLL